MSTDFSGQVQLCLLVLPLHLFFAVALFRWSAKSKEVDGRLINEEVEGRLLNEEVVVESLARTNFYQHSDLQLRYRNLQQRQLQQH